LTHSAQKDTLGDHGPDEGGSDCYPYGLRD